MKKLIAIAACALMVVAAHAQGTVNVRNVDAGATPPTAPITRDGTVAATVTLVAQLFAGADLGSAVAVGSPVAVNSAGLFLGQPTAVPGFAAGTPVPFAFVQAWDSSVGSYDAAALLARGQSENFAIASLGGGVNLPPTLLTGANPMQSFGVTVVPEPTTVALGIIGAVALAFVGRRRK